MAETDYVASARPLDPQFFLTMNRSFKLIALLTSASLFAGAAAFAAHDEKKSDKPVASAEAKAAYPLKVCVVSDDKLDNHSMGGPVDYFYQEKGKPDRLVIFCCKDCVKDFEKEPAKYLAKIDAAAAAHAKAAPAPAHQH
jgi:hypothetical protein